MVNEVLSPRTCSVVAGRVVRGGFIQIIPPCHIEHPGTGVYVPGLVYICYMIGVRTRLVRMVCFAAELD
jgi:hypothetical protein